MKSTYFSNKKSLQIVSNKIREDIKTLINSIGSFNLTSKYYTFLNKKNVNNLKESDFQVSLSTFGKKFILFITKYNTKKYCIFINKKNDSMTVTQLKFTDDIFLGTLFDGELVKNSNDKWIFLINDIAYYKGVNIVTRSFTERQSIIDNILLNEHDNNYRDTDESLYISKKYYFDYKYIKDLVENYMNCLNYKCSGLYFKSINNFSDNYLFIYPECRSDSKILNNGVTVDNNFKKMETYSVSHENSVFHEECDKDNLFDDVEIIKTNFQNKNYSNVKLEKTTCKFLINPTSMPDIYELYCKSNNSNEKYSYASVPDIETSDFLKNILSFNANNVDDMDTKIENNSAVYVECNYHKSFKKWIPFKRADCMDNISTVNQIQIILDSL